MSLKNIALGIAIVLLMITVIVSVVYMGAAIEHITTNTAQYCYHPNMSSTSTN